MNKGGESKAMVGGLIIIAVAIIIGVNLFTSSAQNLEIVRNTYNVANSTFSSVNGTTGVYVTGCQRMSNIVIYNVTTGGTVASGNYSTTNYYVYNGALATRFNVTAETAWGGHTNGWNVSYTCEPYGYDTSSGGRAVAGLIIVLFALALVVVSMWPVLKDRINLGVG